MTQEDSSPICDYQRRFGGVSRLYGVEGLARLQAARVCVIGIGGVGSWVAEALARTAVGAITLIDLDMVAESNVNRQIHALGDVFGQAKVDVMAERIRAINPSCNVTTVEDFVTAENVRELLTNDFDYVIDAIDNVRVKTAILSHCKQADIPIITAGGAGGQIDPTKIRIDDLARTTQDPLLSKVRSKLRKEHSYPRDPKKKFAIPAVYSEEPLRYPPTNLACDAAPSGSGLNCAGYGSSVAVTAVFGFMAAGRVIEDICKLGRK